MLGKLLLSVVPLIALTSISAAQVPASLDEARAMAEAAAAFLVERGPEIAFPAFSFGPEWHDRDLYVIALSLSGDCGAHGGNPDLVGQNLIELTDPNGLMIVREFVAVEDRAWIDYLWPNPLSGQDEPMRGYIIRVGDFVVGVSTYAPQNLDGAPAGVSDERSDVERQMMN